ncbi:MFS general substrate transporter [Aspergillus varians]
MTRPALPSPVEGAPKEEPPKHHYSWRFWVIFPALCITGFLASLEGSLVTTAMPTINNELRTGSNYIWAINAFFLTSAALQPLYGQLANIFGRRWVTVGAYAIFLLGSGVAGGASSANMLIAGRAIQGAGSGCLVMMLDLVVSDLVPVRQRASFMGITFAAVNIGTALGPFVGGIIVDTISWRWAFYINLPIAGAATVVVFCALNTGYRKDLVKERLRRIDLVGNSILVASTVSILFALSYGGAVYSWSSWHVLVPLLLGFAGYALFVGYEASGIPSQPVVPLRLFANRTSAGAYFITTVWSILSMWRVYFLSVYFQGVRASSPARAGVQILPSVLMLLPAVILSGGVLKRTGKFIPIHLTGLALTVVGHGLYTILSPTSSTATWVLVQIVTGFFSNLVLPCLLPAVQAGLAETDTAAATAFWGFLRSFGIIWGVTVPAAIFNNRFGSLLDTISDPDVRDLLSAGHAYERASKAFVNSYSDPVRSEIINAYSESLKRTWHVSIAFAGVAFLAVFIEREVAMRTTVESEYGLKQEKGKDLEKKSGEGEGEGEGEGRVRST